MNNAFLVHRPQRGLQLQTNRPWRYGATPQCLPQRRATELQRKERERLPKEAKVQESGEEGLVRNRQLRL